MTMTLVTGGAGFIGSHIVAKLLAEGEDVRVLDNLSTGNLANLHGLRNHVEFIDGDIREEALVRRAMSGVTTVFHQAAVASVQLSIDDPRQTMEANADGTLTVLLAARDAGCERFVFASSSAVYGESPISPKTEDLTPDPRSPYAISKLFGEHLCSTFADLYGMQTVALRYFNVFGPRQDPDSPYSAVIPIFARLIREGDVPVVYGDGEQSRDFVHIDNVVKANLCAARTAGVSGQVFNVGTGEGTTINAMLRQLALINGTSSRADYRPARAGDIRHSVADISRAKHLLGYGVITPFEEGLAHTVLSYHMATQTNRTSEGLVSLSPPSSLNGASPAHHDLC